MVREAETVFSENNSGFRTFKLTAMPGSEFMLDTFGFSASRRDALPSAIQPPGENSMVGGRSSVGGFGGLDWMTLGLIIGGTALCLIVVVVVAVVIVRRRSNSRSSSSSSIIADSTDKLNSAMDMRPALNAVHESSLASTQELTDMPPPPYATTGSSGQDTGGLYLPLPEQGQQRYLDLQVKPASERGANLYQTSGQALAGRLPQVNSYQQLQNMTTGASTYGELERKFGAGYDSVPDGLGSPRSVGTATSSLPTVSLGSGPIVAPRTLAPPNLSPPRTMAPPILPPPRMQAYNNLPGAGVPRAGPLCDARRVGRRVSANRRSGGGVMRRTWRCRCRRRCRQTTLRENTIVRCQLDLISFTER
jgi:hypothetical protein